MIAPDDLPFLDVPWLAIDGEDHVAVFTSGGGGVIPPTAVPSVLSGRDLEEEIFALPAFSDALGLKAPLVDSFTAAAERGFFVFDCESPHQGDLALQRSYSRVAHPSHALPASALPPDLRAVARVTSFAPLRFAAVEEIVLSDAMGP